MFYFHVPMDGTLGLQRRLSLCLALPVVHVRTALILISIFSFFVLFPLLFTSPHLRTSRARRAFLKGLRLSVPDSHVPHVLLVCNDMPIAKEFEALETTTERVLVSPRRLTIHIIPQSEPPDDRHARSTPSPCLRSVDASIFYPSPTSLSTGGAEVDPRPGESGILGLPAAAKYPNGKSIAHTRPG